MYYINKNLRNTHRMVQFISFKLLKGRISPLCSQLLNFNKKALEVETFWKSSHRITINLRSSLKDITCAPKFLPRALTKERFNEFAKLSKARRDHWSLLIEDHKSLMKVGPPQKYFKLKKFKVKKFLSWEISVGKS